MDYDEEENYGDIAHNKQFDIDSFSDNSGMSS